MLTATSRDRRIPVLWWRVAIVAFVGSATGAAAQEHPIRIEASVPATRGPVRPGDTVTVVVRATIPPGWHLYSLTQPPGGPVATTIDAGPRALVAQTALAESPLPLIEPDPNFGIQSEWYADSAVFRLPILISPLAAGRREVDVRVGYQTCTSRYCLPPTEDTVHVAITVSGAAVAGAPTFTPVVARPVSSRSGARAFALFLWLAATMGALSLLTPCVFPMVPITISYFSRGERASRPRAAWDALLYGAGIVVAFTGTGVGLSLALGVAGLNRFAANPWLNLGIATLFIAFAANLFGVLQLSLPNGLVTALYRASDGTRYGRAATTLLMGVTFALTTFTCTAPFVGTLLVSAARGDWRWPVAGLVAFSTVFALPFLILALVPHALARLPRSGQWLMTMKGTLAFIELAAALKFLSNADLVEGWGIFTRQTVVAIWIAIAGLATLYLIGARIERWRVRRTAPWHFGASAVALGVTLYLASGLGGRRLGELESFLPPAGAGMDGVAGAGELSWVRDDFAGGLEKARTQGKLVLLDFTGYTCTNCRWMEANMFPRPEVAAELREFVRVRLFTDGRGARYREQQALEQTKFQTVALPLYAIVDSLGAPRATFLGMTRDPLEFVRFLAAARGAQ